MTINLKRLQKFYFKHKFLFYFTSIFLLIFIKDTKFSFICAFLFLYILSFTMSWILRDFRFKEKKIVQQKNEQHNNIIQ